MSCICKFRYSHWPCVISIRQTIRPLAKDVGVLGAPWAPHRYRYYRCITIISLDIIPSMNPLQPINSCDASNLLYCLPVPCSTSIMLIPSLPLVYWSIYLQIYVWMPNLFSHLSKILIDWYSASTSHASLQESTCVHVYTHWSQLGHVWSWCSLYCDWIRFVPDILITCLHAHSWNDRGNSCNVS